MLEKSLSLQLLESHQDKVRPDEIFQGISNAALDGASIVIVQILVVGAPLWLQYVLYTQQQVNLPYFSRIGIDVRCCHLIVDSGTTSKAIETFLDIHQPLHVAKYLEYQAKHVGMCRSRSVSRERCLVFWLWAGESHNDRLVKGFVLLILLH